VVQRSLLGILAVAAVLLAGTGAAFAEPQAWEWGFQPAASPVAEDIHWFYDYVLLPMMLIISAFVAVLLVYVLFRFRRGANPNPARTTHNTLLEVVWTGVPILILIGIAVPSLRLLYFEATVPEAALTLKVTGHQWYWSYEYPDQGGISFDAIMVDEADLQDGQPRLLTTDNEVVLPVGEVVRVQVTSEDVIHSWAMPPAGVKTDAVPGRLNELWIELDEPGMYYGQCSELCGVLHGFMPITIRVVTAAEFETWVGQKQAELGIEAPVEVAAATQN
jgi:cytochrome c oxidase subunit 2